MNVFYAYFDLWEGQEKKCYIEKSAVLNIGEVLEELVYYLCQWIIKPIKVVFHGDLIGRSFHRHFNGLPTS